jgi:hypothetical protein
MIQKLRPIGVINNCTILSANDGWANVRNNSSEVVHKVRYSKHRSHIENKVGMTGTITGTFYSEFMQFSAFYLI